MKLSTRLVAVGALATVVGAVGMSATSIAGDHKVTICHADTLDDGTVQFDTITISSNALSAHLDGHEGDYLGACEEVATTTTVAEDTTTTVAEDTTTTTVAEDTTTTTVAEDTTTTTVAEETTTTQPAVVVEPPDPAVVDPAEDEPPLLLPATR